jgi:spermidine synthase
MNWKNNNKIIKTLYNINGVTSELFYGDVLALGLGTGLMIREMKVDSIDVVENDPNQIKTFGEGLNVIEADAFTYKTDKKYDIIFADIWYYSSDIKELDAIKENFKNNLKEGGKIVYLHTVFRRSKK